MRRKHYQIINSKTWYLQNKYFILAGIIIVIVELELILHTDAVKQVRPWTRDLSIQRVRRNCKTAKELGIVLQFVSHVCKHARFVLKEPRGERLENNLARLFDRHLSLHAMRLTQEFVGTS